MPITRLTNYVESFKLWAESSIHAVSATAKNALRRATQLIADNGRYSEKVRLKVKERLSQPETIAVLFDL